MNTFTQTIAITLCIVALGGCAAESGDATAVLEGTSRCDGIAAVAASDPSPANSAAYEQCVIGNSASVSHALTANHVDCQAIHDALMQHGIDPAMLTPDVVRDACVNSGQTSDDLCDAVATACFGPQDDCADPNAPGQPTPPQPNDDFCQLVYEQIAGQNVDPANATDEQIAAACTDQNVDPQLCAQVQQCFGNSGGNGHPTDPNGDDFCQLIYDSAMQNNLDPAQISAEEAYQACLAQNQDDALCAMVANQCFGSNGNAIDPNQPGGEQVDCAAIEQMLAEQGYQAPLDPAVAEQLREACVQYMNDPAICDRAVACVI